MHAASLRQSVYALLNPDDDSTAWSRGVNGLLISLILLNLLAISLQTVPSLDAQYGKAFHAFELLSVVLFSVEFLARWWTSIESNTGRSRRQYLLSFDALVDLISILPLYISLLLGVELRALIALRLLRLLKLVRYFSPLIMLAQVVRAEARAFLAAVFILLVLVFVAASGIYFFEREVQPDVFGNIPEAMWWATVTLTTLGYGDVVPVTTGGKIFAAVMTVMSVGTVALPAGMLASRFSEELNKRKGDYSVLVNRLQADGELDGADLTMLENARLDLCLSRRDAQSMLTESAKSCPHCYGTGKEIAHYDNQ